MLEANPGALVVRLPLLYGDSGGRARGASDSLLAACERGEKPPMFIDEWRTPLAVGDAARACVELARGGATGLCHVAGADRVSRHELALALLVAHGMSEDQARSSVQEVRREDVPTCRERPADVSLNASRARALLDTRLAGVADGARRALR